MPYKDKQKHREYQLAWYHKRRHQYLGDKACVQCGAKDQLEFNHIDPTTKVSHRIWGWCKEKLEAELAKCEILCRDCHIKHHRPLDHGVSMYRYGCRCDVCKQAKRLSRYAKAEAPCL